jgi:ERCC4-related helicase
MLDRLLKLYSKNGGSVSTPLEDFTTEALAGTDFIVFENLQDTLAKCYEFLDTVKPNFEQKFCGKTKMSNAKSINQILENNRTNSIFWESISSNTIHIPMPTVISNEKPAPTNHNQSNDFL